MLTNLKTFYDYEMAMNVSVIHVYNFNTI